MVYLFVSENEEHSFPELVFCEHSHQFVSSLSYALAIVWINNKNETLGILEVVTPQRPEKKEENM